MSLSLISLGLYDIRDMSKKALDEAKLCNVLYFEDYTGYYNTSLEDIEKIIGFSIERITRQGLENNSDKILKESSKNKVGILVVGDALSATTHSSLLLEAKQKGIHVNVIHGSSVFTAIAETGLFLYNFGKTTSIPFNNKNVYEPYNVIKSNKPFHTLLLLDLKDGKYMNAHEAIEYLLRVEKEKKEKVFTENTLCVVCSALGSDNSEIIAGKAEQLLNKRFTKKPQCLIVPGKMHFHEEEFLETLK
ncbi:MAG: diphthine synthase [Candidatus Nanoarchaeia archaeon]|nr:diphthine synthase [Candidatus Nanoarchaeia archaeon]